MSDEAETSEVTVTDASILDTTMDRTLLVVNANSKNVPVGWRLCPVEDNTRIYMSIEQPLGNALAHIYFDKAGAAEFMKFFRKCMASLNQAAKKNG